MRRQGIAGAFLAALIILAGFLALRPELALAFLQKEPLIQFLIAIPAIMAGSALLIGGLVLLAGENELGSREAE